MKCSAQVHWFHERWLTGWQKEKKIIERTTCPRVAVFYLDNQMRPSRLRLCLERRFEMFRMMLGWNCHWWPVFRLESGTSSFEKNSSYCSESSEQDLCAKEHQPFWTQQKYNLSVERCNYVNLNTAINCKYYVNISVNFLKIDINNYTFTGIPCYQTNRYKLYDYI